MSSMNFSTAKQVVKPPQRGIFPLDHDAECRSKMEVGKSAEVHRMYSESFLEYMAQAWDKPCNQKTDSISVTFLRGIHTQRFSTQPSNYPIDSYPFRSDQEYLSCMQGAKDMHHKCRDFSRDYLQCRMENKLMSKENLDNVSLLQCFKSFVVQ